MTIQDVIKKIEGYHPDLGPSYKGCDGIKCGNPDVECTGIVTALVPTVDVIKKTAELGYNMLYVHEPTSYLTPDYPVWKADFKCDVYDEKIKLATDNGIVIYRDHDHTHDTEKIWRRSLDLICSRLSLLRTLQRFLHR